MTTKQHISKFAGLGMNQNRLAGPQSRRLQNLRAGRFGAANKGRQLDGAARQAVENRLRQEGRIS
jgi:hypothetical protein